MMAILTGVRSNLIVVLISIPLMASDAEHFFICLWTLCMFLFGEVSVQIKVYLSQSDDMLGSMISNTPGSDNPAVSFLHLILRRDSKKDSMNLTEIKAGKSLRLNYK